MPSSSRPKWARLTSNPSRSSDAPANTANQREVRINVYDLLPPGRLSNLLWTLGSPLLHSGVVISNRELAYGGHARPNVTGVYFTKPGLEPPGGTFRSNTLHGVTTLSDAEINAVMRELSDEFPGTKYNLLTNNCNHFTSVLCGRLTGRAAPAWINRAAGIGLALPCVVPREWVTPPDCETADGELVGDEVPEEQEGESAGMMESDRRRREREEDILDGAVGSRPETRPTTPPPRIVSMRDTSGRDMPVAERAPVPSKR